MPPSINAIITKTFDSVLNNKASGMILTLFQNEPLATCQTIGNSRSALTPVTCWALTAKSSPTTPAVFFAATFVIAATSSKIAAISSNNIKKLPPATFNLSLSYILVGLPK